MKYNFKDTELLQIGDFCCEECLSDDIAQTVYNLRKYETVEVYAKAELIEKLISNLHGSFIDDNEITLGMVDFDGKGNDYVGEYCLSLTDDYTLWCEPACRLNEETGEYELFNSDATLAYVYQEDCHQDLIDMLEKNEVPTLLFGFEEG